MFQKIRECAGAGLATVVLAAMLVIGIANCITTDSDYEFTQEDYEFQQLVEPQLQEP